MDTSMEMVDIVDENDNILSQTTKKEAHEKGLLHRTVISQDYTRCSTPKELQDSLKQNPEMFGDAFHFVVKTFYRKLLS
ncbi:MAG: hypothetical protein AAB567_00430 [Patescibacteria group bacterium]